MKKNILFPILLYFIFAALPSNIFSQWPATNFCRIGLSVPIYDHQTAKDSILISMGGGWFIHDLNLRIDTLRHTWIGDVSIYLRKGNVGVRVFNKTGGSGDDMISTVFNDSAAIPIGSGTAPFTGHFRPDQPLTVFNNIPNPDGYWVLAITDTVSADTGHLERWCIVIQYSIINGGIHSVEIPNTYRLYQNYPNPFNPVSKIKYGVPKNGYVKLAVYDELGRLVALLQDGEKYANTYEVDFDATNLPSGVYYYKLEADGFSETKKMVVLK